MPKPVEIETSNAVTRFFKNQMVKKQDRNKELSREIQKGKIAAVE